MNSVDSRAPLSADSPKPSEVEHALQAVLSSEGFRRSGRMSRFLRHVVEHALAGDQGQLKEAVIGHAVFDRPPDYDTKQDPVVRNEARRLRSKLQHFYETGGGALAGVLIEIPRGGYAPHFAPVEASSGAPLPESTVEIGTPPTAQSRSPWLLALGATAVIAIIALAFWTSRPLPPPVFGKVKPVTSSPDSELHAAFAPGSKDLVFSSNAAGNYDIYLRRAGGSVSRLTANPADDLQPSFSPDGTRIAFARVQGAGYDVLILRLADHSEAKIARIEGLQFGNPVADVTQIFGSPGPAWSPTGEEIAITTASVSNPEQRAIHLVEATSGKMRQLTHPANQQHDLDPAFSPDGSYLAFCRWHTNSASEIHIIPVSTGDSRKITHEQADFRGLVWMPDAKSLVVSSNRSGLFGLWHLGLSDGALRPLALTAGNARDPAISPDGAQLVFSHYSQQSEIWRSSTVFHPKGLGLHEAFVRSSRQNHSGQISPDGSRVAFVSDRSGAWEIWVEDLAVATAYPVTRFDGPMTGSVRWSPDGKRLAFDARPEGHSNIYVVDALRADAADSPAPLQPWSRGTFEDKMPSWSGDGKWLYFNSNRGGQQQLWRAPLAHPENATLVASGKASDSAESPGGNAVYFADLQQQLWRAPLTGGPAERLPGFPQAHASRLWTVFANAIWYIPTGGNPPEVHRFDLATSQSRAVATLAGAVVDGTPSLSISPNGEWVIYALRRESKSELLMLETP